VITSIDLRAVLASSVGSPHSDLVTRSTGAKVRGSIEASLSAQSTDSAVVLDFSSVRVLDCSCADEVVAKLLLHRPSGPGGPTSWFVIRGLTESHAEEIDYVLRRRRLALVAEERDGHPRLLGEVDPSAAAAWQVVLARGSAAEQEVADALPLAIDETRRALDALVGAGIVRRAEGRYLTLTTAA
jgi:hypothetical protein